MRTREQWGAGEGRDEGLGKGGRARRDKGGEGERGAGGLNALGVSVITSMHDLRCHTSAAISLPLRLLCPTRCSPHAVLNLPPSTIVQPPPCPPCRPCGPLPAPSSHLASPPALAHAAMRGALVQRPSLQWPCGGAPARCRRSVHTPWGSSARGWCRMRPHRCVDRL